MSFPLLYKFNVELNTWGFHEVYIIQNGNTVKKKKKNDFSDWNVHFITNSLSPFVHCRRQARLRFCECVFFHWTQALLWYIFWPWHMNRECYVISQKIWNVCSCMSHSVQVSGKAFQCLRSRTLGHSIQIRIQRCQLAVRTDISH